MAEPTPVLTGPLAEKDTYRPLSVLAVASLVIAGIYSVIILAYGLVSFINGTPIFLPPWGLAVPIVAIVLALLGRRQIRTSEGSRSGLALANWGWRLGMVFGIVHAGILFGTLLAVGMQAESEVKSNFFENIREGRVEDAFVFTLPPEQRGNREEIRIRFKPIFNRFKENDIVRILDRGRPNAKIESLGIKNIDPTKDGYDVTENYRVTTPEGTFVIQLGLRTRDSKESPKRRWQLIWKEPETALVSKELTPLGEKMDFWLKMAHEFAGAWMMERNTGRTDLAYINTCSPKERVGMTKQYLVRFSATILASIGAALGETGQGFPAGRFGFLANTNLGCAQCIPGFNLQAFQQLLDKSELEVPKKDRDEVLKLVYENLLRPENLGFKQEGTSGVIRKVEADSPHLEGRFPFSMAIRGENNANFAGTAELIVVSDPLAENEASLPVWRVSGLKLLTAGPPPSAQGKGLRALPTESIPGPPGVR
jgi:hypothetical protein